MAGTSRPVYTSTADGFRTAEEIAALRPMAEPKPRAPRKTTAKPSVSSGIVCFCGVRFSEAQSLEFMLHLRAEVGEDLAVLERLRDRRRKDSRRRYADPVIGARIREQMAEYRRTPEQLARKAEYDRRRREDPAIRERKREQGRQYRSRKKAEGVSVHKALTPEQRERKNALSRQSRARQKAEREAQAADAGALPRHG